MNRNGRQTLHNLEKSIENLQKTAGKDIHSEKWKRCVEHVKEQGDVDNAYAVCTASLGQDSFKSFAKSHELTGEDINKINMRLLKDQTARLEETAELQKTQSQEVPQELNKSFWSADPHRNIIITPTVDLLWGQKPMPSPLDTTTGIESLEKNRERF